MHKLYERGLSYSTLNTARSALSSFVTIEDTTATVGNHTLVSRFLKGVFNLKPSVRRYRQIWDPRLVFNQLRKWGPLTKLTLKQLTLKLCVMLAFLGAARTRLLRAYRTNKMEVGDNHIILRVDDLMKSDRPGKVGHELTACLSC